MKPYSMDLRERVLKDCDAGQATRAVSTKSRSWWVASLGQEWPQLTVQDSPWDKRNSHFSSGSVVDLDDR